MRARRAAVVGLAYYLGAHIGFLLVTPSAPQSVLWLPNSILLAATMSTEPRRWTSMFLACLPAQLLVAVQSHAPLDTMSLLFLTNVLDAALGGMVWRSQQQRMSGHWDLQSMLLFLAIVATVPTVLLSFADAAITELTGWGSDYWMAFATRARANVVTNVVFVPAAFALFTGWGPELTEQWRARWREGALLLLGLGGTIAITSIQLPPSSARSPIAYLLIPFLLWAALRFGVGITSAALVELAYVTSWLAIRGTVAPGEPLTGDGVLVLQSRLFAIAIPSLCLAAVVADRQATAAALSASQNALHQSLAEIGDLAGRLISAAEAERARIARELHDDVNQQIAALSIGLSALRWRSADARSVDQGLAALQGQCMAIAEGVRVLSHELHPAVLRHAGLVPALRELCDQFGRRFPVHADLVAQVTDIELPPDVVLCVYRVAQEAMRNAARHSGARSIRIRVALTIDRIELSIRDDGCGFDVGRARARNGLGLISIEERVRLLRGEMFLNSAPGQGTRLRVRIPVGDRHDSSAPLTRG